MKLMISLKDDDLHSCLHLNIYTVIVRTFFLPIKLLSSVYRGKVKTKVSSREKLSNKSHLTQIKILHKLNSWSLRLLKKSGMLL